MPELHEYERYRRGVPSRDAVKTPFDPHWNALGNRLYAEQLATALVEDGFLPQPSLAAGQMSRPGGTP
jgi:hypothetical protein